jgi:hypothetical protein
MAVAQAGGSSSIISSGAGCSMDGGPVGVVVGGGANDAFLRDHLTRHRSYNAGPAGGADEVCGGDWVS